MDIKKIKLEDKARDFNWISKLFDEGKLYIDDLKLTKTLFDKFRLLVKTTQEVYENAWDLEIEKYGPDSINIKGIIILFKNITIKNSQNKEHHIKDLFVKMNLYVESGTSLKILDLSGGRTTVSYDEWASGYIHSHLPQNVRENSTPPYWGSFCRGSGHINDFMAEINSAGGFKEENLTPFLIQILGLISWESLEGGPHKKFSNVRANPTSGRIFNFNSFAIKTIKDIIITYHKENKIIPNLDFKLESGIYSIVDNEKLNKFVLETIPLTDQQKKTLISITTSDGRSYAYGNLPGFRTPPNISNKYIFQGQEVPVIIGNPPSLEGMTDSNYRLNPKVKEYIKQELEYDINTKKIRKSTIDRYSSKDGNATQSTESNKMALQRNT